ncbi:MAG: efflux RND transporter permease subunit [candidate division Zixibacteria bacterium]|nr:efflux RND transporter permease subunit [candidate division Zixibacteria bacterium]
MKKVITYLIRYPVWVSVIFITVIGFGLLSLTQLRYSFFPELTPDNITIQVAYPGASPEEVAEGVTLKIEENLDGLEGIERVTSVSRENFCTVTVEIAQGTEIEKALADVKNAIDRINSFPVDSEKPVIFEQKFRTRSLSVVLYGETDLYNLKYIAERLRDTLLEYEEISQVDIDGLPNLEFSIEVSESDMRRYNVNFNEIAEAVRTANINISGGKLETDDEEILIRAYGRDYHAEDLQDIVIRGTMGGTVIYLKDIAVIKEQWEDVPDKIYYNNSNALVLNIDQAKDEDILAIAEITKNEVEQFGQSHGAIEALVIDDRTIPLSQRINLLTRNGIIGLILVLSALGFFLNLRLSLWVAVSIPFSFAGMLVIASFAGITINVISLFGMIIVIGILVDDGIVVGENIFSHYERGKPALKAAIDGTTEVVAPVFTSVVSTVIVFLAFFFLAGMIGKFMWQMALVVIASLIFSLIEAFFILPSHLAHSKGLSPHETDSAIRQRIERIIKYLTYRIYAPVLKAALDHKWITIVTPGALVMLTIGLIGGGIIGVTFFPNIDGDTVPINVSLVAGSKEVQTDSLLESIERKCWIANEELKSERDDNLDVILGIERQIGSNTFGESGSHTGQLLVQLLDGEVRNMDSYVVANRIREIVGPLTQVQNVTFGAAGRFGKPVSISLLGNEFEQLDKARTLLAEELKQFSTLKDVTDTDQKGRREIDIKLKPRAHALGLTLKDVAGQVRQGFYGQEIQRIQRGRDEIRVWVRYKPEDRAALSFLDQMRIRTANGSEYPFTELAEYDIERGVTQINHLNRMREIKVEANLANVEDDLPPILAEIKEDVLPRVLAQVHDVKASFEGQSREQAKMQDSMMIVFPVVLLCMFILIVLVFRSYAQAWIIFSLIPIGILGAVWGHGIQGLQVNMLSLAGIMALSGIIINDSIVFVDQINRFLREGQTVRDAVFNSGIARLRPILLTTLTTSLGLAPLIFETSRQAQFLIPMAVSVAYGLMFGTMILLLILPALFLAFNTVRFKWATIIMKSETTREIVEPAVKELQFKLEERKS